jgi:hypothetical protein
MADISYFVRLFERNGDRLVVSSLIEASDYLAAIGEAMRRAQEVAGAFVFAGIRSGKTWSDIQIILKIGDVPDTFDVLNMDP